MRRSLIVRYISLLGTLAFVAPVFLAAQSTPALERGARLRVTTAENGVVRTGKFRSLDSTSIVLLNNPVFDGYSASKRPPSTIPLSSIVKLEVGRGRPGAVARILGATLVGMVAGGWIGGTLGSRATMDCGCDDPGYGALLAVPAGALLGGMVSGAVMHAFSRDVWVSIPVPAGASR